MTDAKRIFVIDLLRAFYESGDAAACGKSACTLLGAICMEYDRFRCQRPVRWAVKTIELRTGLSRSAIYQARGRLMEAGWLLYVEGAHRKVAARYTPQMALIADEIQPQSANLMELVREFRSYMNELDTKTIRTLNEELTNARRNRDETEPKRIPYIPIPNPNPNPNPGIAPSEQPFNGEPETRDPPRPPEVTAQDLARIVYARTRYARLPDIEPIITQAITKHGMDAVKAWAESITGSFDGMPDMMEHMDGNVGRDRSTGNPGDIDPETGLRYI